MGIWGYGALSTCHTIQISHFSHKKTQRTIEGNKPTKKTSNVQVKNGNQNTTVTNLINSIFQNT